MAAKILRGAIYFFLLTSLLVGGSNPACEQQKRSRKPLLDSLRWETYWVPLMIILGGCCAMAWSILFIAYDVAQPAQYGLYQTPYTLEQEPQVGCFRKVPQKETKENSNPLETETSKELLETSLETKECREEIELDRTGSQQAVGDPQQSEKSKGAKEELETPLEMKISKEGIENQLEKRGSEEGISSPFLQGTNDPASLRLDQVEDQPCGRADQVEDQPCGKLWSTMEKEIERLLQLLRFCRSAGPGLLAEESLGPAIEEVMPPPAIETPNPAQAVTPLPTQAQEPPTIPAEETLRLPSSGQSTSTMHFIISGRPRSTCPNTGQRRQGGKRGRK